MECLTELRRMNIKVGSCTGYPSAIVETLKPIAAAQGYVPDVYVAADEVPQARPMPYMVGGGWLGAGGGNLCEGLNYECVMLKCVILLPVAET